MADRPKVPPLFTLQFYENEEEEAVCHAFRDTYNLPNTVSSHLVSQVTAMHQQFLQTEEEEESEWEEEDESYEEEEVEEDSESDAPLPQKPLQQPDAGGDIINPFTPPPPPITEKEKTKIVNKLYEDAKRRNEEQRKKEEEKRKQQEEEEAKLELAEPRHVVEGRVYGETDDQPPHPECTFHPTIRKKSQNLASTRRTLTEEDGSDTTRLYKDAMKRKESQSALEEDTPQFKDSLRGSSRVGGRTIRNAHSSDRMNDTTQISQELTEKMEKEIAQQKYLEGTKKNRKERLDNERDEKEQPKTTFRKRIVLPSDEISPKKVTLVQNRIDSITARLDHEAKEQSKTARPDKKSLKTVEQKQRKRIDEVVEKTTPPPQQNQETEALLNVTELGVVISLSQPSASIRKWKNLNKPHFETSALSPTLPTRIEDASSPYFTTQNLSTPKTELSVPESFEPFPQQSPLSGTGKTSFLSLASLDAVHRIRHSIAFSTDLESPKDVDAELIENEEPPFGLSFHVWEGGIHHVAFILEEKLRSRGLR
ncbi:hypothetical protein BLNAU_24242 [Blattamonas nauphoetae]|uniref:Uncharacterized protein n=1 Tax=Blattamonas nauphoetae TaxID=2049346 RepID=A0ABQ9WNV9_9EUKA|nr:hypothetical protein BLNAU_24242 [Blattamonas nauphoetae]